MGKQKEKWRQMVEQLFGYHCNALLDHFSCAVRKSILLHGRLYVCDSFVGFYSRVFGKETKVKYGSSELANALDCRDAVLTLPPLWFARLSFLTPTLKALTNEKPRFSLQQWRLLPMTVNLIFFKAFCRGIAINAIN